MAKILDVVIKRCLDGDLYMLIKKQKISDTSNYLYMMRLPFRDEREAKNAIIDVGSVDGVPYFWYQADYNDEYEMIMDAFCVIGIQADYKYDDVFQLDNYIGSVYISEKKQPLFYFIFQYDEIYANIEYIIDDIVFHINNDIMDEVCCGNLS